MSALTPTHLLFETATGLAIFKTAQVEEIGNKTRAVQAQIADLHTFSKMVTLVSFAPFKSAVEALQACLDISEGVVDENLKELLRVNFESTKGVLLGVSERNLASSIVAETGLKCDTGERTLELLRGIRLHAEKLLKGLSEGDIAKAQLGLGHSYSRSKVKFNVNRSDNMIIQAIALVDTLDKDVNTFAMRVKEWYGWHFPELAKIAPDTVTYAKLARYIKNKEDLTELDLEDLAEILGGDETLARNILDAARASMGTQLSAIDMSTFETFADRVVTLGETRKHMHQYLVEKMHLVAPNLSALLGEIIGARLIAHAGSLTNLAKYPASTVQILGAEKALFRALKTKGNTPKYGLIYHASAIQRAAPKNKGRMSRFLANKISIACRIDCFSDSTTLANGQPNDKFGAVMAQQVEERLEFYETGKPPGKNSDAMRRAIDALEGEAGDLLMDVDGEDEDDAAEPGKEEKKAKKDKKAKKEKKDKKEKSSSSDKKKSKDKEAKLEKDKKKAEKKAAKKAKKD